MNLEKFMELNVQTFAKAAIVVIIEFVSAV